MPTHVLDPAPGDGVHLIVLQSLYNRDDLTPADRAALIRVGFIMRHLASEAGEMAA